MSNFELRNARRAVLAAVLIGIGASACSSNEDGSTCFANVVNCDSQDGVISVEQPEAVPAPGNVVEAPTQQGGLPVAEAAIEIGRVPMFEYGDTISPEEYVIYHSPVGRATLAVDLKSAGEYDVLELGCNEGLLDVGVLPDASIVSSDIDLAEIVEMAEAGDQYCNGPDGGILTETEALRFLFQD